MEILEREIAKLRTELSQFMRSAEVDMKELKHGVNAVNGHIADLMMEVGDAPDHRYREAGRPNIRSRLHELENDQAAARAAKAALEAAETARAQAIEAMTESKRHNWTTLQKAGLFLFAFVGAADVVLRAAGVN